MKIKKILFSQNAPANLEKTPYADLMKKYGVKVDFYKFFQVEGLTLKEFQKSKINILDYSAIIITNKNAVDHFFRIVEESKIKLPITLKFFCSNPATANYLQKYTVYRKRKIFFAEDGTVQALVKEVSKCAETDNFLVPCPTDSSLNELLKLIDSIPNINYTKAEMFKIVFPDMSQSVHINDYDMIVLFSPYGVQSLFQSFPDYQQGKTIFAASGLKVLTAAQKSGLDVEIWAPQPETPSIFMALEKYLQNFNRKR